MDPLFEKGISNQSSSEFARNIIAGLRQDLGVDILPILLDDQLSYAQKRHQASVSLFHALVARGEASEDRAEWGPGTDFDENAFLAAFEAGDVDVEPNVGYTQKIARQLRELEGQDVKDYLFSLTKRFENAAKATTPGQLALNLAGGAIFGVSIAWIKEAYKAFKAGEKFLSAIRTGVTKIGLKTAIVTVVIVLVGFLLWLIFENPKKCLGLVLNDTDEDLVVRNWQEGVDGGGVGKDSGLYMNRGTMKSFMQDYADQDLKKKLQIRKRELFGPDDPDNGVLGGIFFGDKSAGFLGAEGIMVFESDQMHFALMFAVPASNDNGTIVAFAPASDLPGLFNFLYPKRSVRSTASNERYDLTSTMNDARGGTIACIASITAKPKA